ncbi:Retrovirus-related Pol polyprotein from type-1 retrotransposable element [Trichinella sp. T6]|nr:Retrovirus-related Pol polyprotein from type-1 retrotransposable element [Trichinella sp. T6]
MTTNEIERRVRAATNEILMRKSRWSQEENRVYRIQNFDILSVMSALVAGCDKTLMEVGSVDVDRVNHFYDFTCEGVIQILPSCYWFLFQWMTFHHDAVLCSIAEEQTRLDNSGVGMLSNVEWFVVEPNVFSPVAFHYPHSMKVSGRSEGPSESSEFFSVWYLPIYCEVSENLKLMNLGSASGLDGVKVSHLREIGLHCLSKQDCNGRRSEVTPLNPHQKAFRCNENLSFDGVTSGCPGEVSKNIIRKECGSSKSRATRVGVETIGIGLLFECGTFETHFENRGRITPSRNNISNALSPQLKDREQGKDLRTRLEEGLTSSNIEMEGLINFLINEVLNIKDKERDTYVDGVVNVFTEFLREPNDHQPRPPPKKRTKEEEKKSRRFEAAAQSVSQSPLSDCVSAPCLSPSPTQKIFCPLFRQALMSAKTSAGLDGVQNCRTTLIPKTDNPRTDADESRPITIASCIYRQFSKIVTRQLENCISLHPRQKAFRDAHKSGKELNIVCVDLAKAFDTVNHSSIDRALRMHGLDSNSRALIAEMVTGSTTVIKGDGGVLSHKIEVNQGVRQGDPISPLLFNSVMDELIERLEQNGVGYKINNTEVVTLAFADDVTLVSSSHRGMEKLLSITHDFINERGLKLNIRKCKGIRFVRTPKTKSLVQDTSKAFKVRGTGEESSCIPMAGPGEFIKILGVPIAPNGKPSFDIDTLEGTLQRIRKAPLKPAQKLAIVRDYLISSLEYKLGVPGVGRIVLDEVDASIRQTVKRFLHLPHTGMNSMFLTMPIKDGGLGLRSLRTQHLARVAVGTNSMMSSADPTSHTIASMPQHQKPLHAALQHFSVPAATKDALKKVKRQLLCAEIAELTETYQGSCLPTFRKRPVGNSWLSGLNGMRSRDFITGLKLRFGVIETRSQKWRGRTPQNPAVLLCRHCGHSTGKRETAAHISQKCPQTKNLNIQRHNKIVHLVAEHARREGFTVHVEHALKSDGQVYKPDLILTKGNAAHVLDVAVPWETGTDMHEHHERKVTKYCMISDDVKAHFGVDSCTVGAIVVGARSSWCASNKTTLKACTYGIVRGPRWLPLKEDEDGMPLEIYLRILSEQQQSGKKTKDNGSTGAAPLKPGPHCCSHYTPLDNLPPCILLKSVPAVTGLLCSTYNDESRRSSECPANSECSQMPRHLISDAVTTAKGTGLAKSAGKEDPVELDSSLTLRRFVSPFDALLYWVIPCQTGSLTGAVHLLNDNAGVLRFHARGMRKVTTGITGLWQPSVHSDVAFSSFDVGSSYHCEAEFAKRWIVHPPIGNPIIHLKNISQSNGILVELGAPKVLFHLVNIGKKQVRIRKAPLKPAQKLATVQDYLIPSLEYRLGVPGISRKLFESVDGAIWLTVKRFLHLPTTGMNSMFLSMPIKEGGLGLRPLTTQHIARVAVGTNSTMTSMDNVSRVVADTTSLRKPLLSALEHFAVPAATKSAIREDKQNLLREEIGQLSETYRSSCLPSFKKASLVNSWLRGTSGMRSRDYIAGLKLRHCSQSSDHLETTAHVSQKCLSTQALIIQRHNKITAIKSGGNVYKPDFVLVKDGTAHIMDVAVPWEKGTIMHESPVVCPLPDAPERQG